MNKKLYRFCIFCGLVSLTGCTFNGAPVGAIEQGPILEISFPEIKDFSTIDPSFQSIDPDLYNFQIWAKRNGLYFYAIQRTKHLTTSYSDNWKNTHYEALVWNGDFGYGWDGTYISLFLDGSFYVNKWDHLEGIYYSYNIYAEDETSVIEYYFHLEFANNGLNRDGPYAYIKQFQYMPEENPVNSQIVERDGRRLITGYEESLGVHKDGIDEYMEG